MPLAPARSVRRSAREAKGESKALAVARRQAEAMPANAAVWKRIGRGAAMSLTMSQRCRTKMRLFFAFSAEVFSENAPLRCRKVSCDDDALNSSLSLATALEAEAAGLFSLAQNRVRG